MRASTVLVGIALLLGAMAEAQPDLNVIRSEDPARPHEPYTVTYRVSWPGDPARYVILPPKVTAVPWAAVNLVKAESVVQGEINTVSYTVSIMPVQTGDFEYPEILIGFRNPEDLTPPETSAPATNPTGPGVDPTLRADPFILHVKPDRTLAWVSGGLGALLLCLLLGWWSARKRRPPAGQVSSARLNGPHACEQHLQEAQGHRQDGRAYEFYVSLNRALELCPADEALSDKIKTCAQKAGYQDVPPTEEEMVSDFEAVRQALDRKQAR